MMYLLSTDKKLAHLYKECKERGWDDLIDDDMLRMIAEGAYASVNGTYEGAKEGYKPYFNYLKYDYKPYQEEVKEEPIMIEDNNYEYEDNYTTPYSFEYEPYFSNDNNYSITFDHEVDTSNTIEMIEEIYNEDNNIEEVDSNEIIDVLSFLTNKVKEVKKSIIHYISNYRPIMNKYTGLIGAILIE